MLQTFFMRASFVVDDDAPVSAQAVENKVLNELGSIPKDILSALYIEGKDGEEHEIELLKGTAGFEVIPPHLVRVDGDSVFLDAEEAARYLGGPITKKYLDDIRGTSKGPRFVKPPSSKPGADGRLVAYRRSDLDEWAASLESFANTTEAAIKASMAS